MAISAETFFLGPRFDGTLQQQIRQMVAEGILTGRFRPGERLPSTRALALHLGVSRITVSLAFTDLVADDYLVARGRAGYFVSDTAPQAPKFVTRPSAGIGSVDWNRAIGQRFSGADAVRRPGNWREFRYPFIYGQADESLFDRQNWRASSLRALGQKDFAPLTGDYYDRDDPMLIEFIARHTLPRRGILAAPDEILLTMGAQNALWLAAQVLLTQRRTAVVEDPCYPAQREILGLSRCHLHPVPVDGAGLPPEAIPPGADVVFTTPSHQCPTTATMPVERREALLARAARDGFLIVEDDYEFEMSFVHAPAPALKSLDRDGRVIYIGSFSKSLFPGLRLGYLVGPAPFIREARALRLAVLRHPPGHIQRTVAYFLSLGHYDALIGRMARAYLQRRQAMDATIARLGLELAGAGAYGGSSRWMRAPDHVDTEILATRLQDDGVLIEPGRAFFAGADAPRNYYRLAYSSIPSERIPAGLEKISDAIADYPIAARGSDRATRAAR
ncbi:MAG: PLP-dependent aminotransferase family protein [Paracoccaceae bacterium]